jgi:nucleotide-binding universal stress UspA family protein
MSAKVVVGLDGSGSGSRAVACAKRLASLIGECELILAYVIEWLPYSFQMPEENAERHKRREAEIGAALTQVVTPAVETLQNDGIAARSLVRHGDVADLLDEIAVNEGADQIVIARSSADRFAERIFGTSAANIVMHASVPVTGVG